jgi:outer membrane beta-barrel protein
VKCKLYPRAGRFEINPLQVGGVLNQSFLRTYLGVFGVGYHFNEWHAVSGEFMLGLSQDSTERTCLENFYFKPDNAAQAGGDPSACDIPDATDPDGGPKDSEGNAAFKRKPAYLGVRQIDQMLGLNYQWTPVYGKQIYFLSFVGHLDLFLNLGAGIAFSTYTPQRLVTASGADIKATGTSVRGEYGKAGRPTAEKQISPVIDIGIGNRFYFANNFLVNLEIRDYTLFGSDGKSGSDISNFIAIWGGLGILF